MSSVLYGLPRYYDIAFSRSISTEMEFFKKCFREYTDLPVRSILDGGCGMGIFLVELSRQGFDMTGYDLSPEMVDYANEQLEQEGFSDRSHAIVADMTDLDLSEHFDAAITLISTVSYCNSDEKIRSHFSRMKQILNPGGIYIIEIVLAYDDIQGEHGPDETWYADQDDTHITVTWCPHTYDYENKLRHITCTMEVNENGEVARYEDHHVLRLWHYQDMLDIFAENGFQLMGVFNQTYEEIPPSAHFSGELGALYFVLKA